MPDLPNTIRDAKSGCIHKTSIEERDAIIGTLKRELDDVKATNRQLKFKLE